MMLVQFIFFKLEQNVIIVANRIHSEVALHHKQSDTKNGTMENQFITLEQIYHGQFLLSLTHMAS